MNLAYKMEYVRPVKEKTSIDEIAAHTRDFSRLFVRVNATFN